MKTILTISMLFLTFITYSQSIALTRITVIEVDDETKKIVNQYSTGSYMGFIVGDTTVNYMMRDHKGGIIEEINYEIIKKETLEETYVINMKWEGVLYELLIPFDKKEDIALSSNGITKIISGKSIKVRE